eukprot:scaffold53860_cov31-Tisochrysis_lutea.AAC.2
MQRVANCLAKRIPLDCVSFDRRACEKSLYRARVRGDMVSSLLCRDSWASGTAVAQQLTAAARDVPASTMSGTAVAGTAGVVSGVGGVPTNSDLFEALIAWQGAPGAAPVRADEANVDSPRAVVVAAELTEGTCPRQHEGSAPSRAGAVAFGKARAVVAAEAGLGYACERLRGGSVPLAAAPTIRPWRTMRCRGRREAPGVAHHHSASVSRPPGQHR